MLAQYFANCIVAIAVDGINFDSVITYHKTSVWYSRFSCLAHTIYKNS